MEKLYLKVLNDLLEATSQFVEQTHIQITDFFACAQISLILQRLTLNMLDLQKKWIIFERVLQIKYQNQESNYFKWLQNISQI